MTAAGSRVPRDHALPAWDAVAEAAGVGPGTAVLDVGCGSGGFCALALGRGAAASGIDASPAAVEAARARAPRGDFRTGRMERLPWPDAGFDVVTGFNAFQYAADVDLALAEAARVARAGGRVAICKWGRPADSDLFAILSALLGRPLPVAERDLVGPAALRAGLEVPEPHEVEVHLTFPSRGALASALHAAGALEAAIARLGGEGALRRMEDVAAPFRQDDGSYRLASRFRYLIARV